MNTETLEIKIESSIATIILNRPSVLNAFNEQLVLDLQAAFKKLKEDNSIRVVILTGSGKGFSAGADRNEHSKDNRKLEVINDYLWKTSNAINNSDVPVICCCDGFVIGAGFFLPCSSDIVLATKDSYFQMPGINFDVLVGSAHLGRLIPKQKVREMVFTGEKVSVENIFSYGGISSIHKSKKNMMERANELASKIVSMNRDSIKVLKKILNSNEPVNVNRALKMEQQLTYQNKLFQTKK